MCGGRKKTKLFNNLEMENLKQEVRPFCSARSRTPGCSSSCQSTSGGHACGVPLVHCVYGILSLFMYACVFLSLSLYVHVSFSLCVCVAFSLSQYVCICLSLSLYVCLCLSPSLCVRLSLSLCVFTVVAKQRRLSISCSVYL